MVQFGSGKNPQSEIEWTSGLSDELSVDLTDEFRYRVVRNLPFPIFGHADGNLCCLKRFGGVNQKFGILCTNPNGERVGGNRGDGLVVA